MAAPATRQPGHRIAQPRSGSLTWEVMADWIFQGNPPVLRPARLGDRLPRAVVGHASLPGPDGGWGPRLAADRRAEGSWHLLRRDDRFRDVRAPRSAIRADALPMADRHPVSTTASARHYCGLSCSRMSGSGRSGRSAASRARTRRCPPDVAAALAARAAPRLEPLSPRHG